MAKANNYFSESDEDPKDLRYFISQISRLSLHEDMDPYMRPDSVVSFRPPTTVDMPSLDLSESCSSDTPTDIDSLKYQDRDSDNEQPDSGLGPSGGDESVVTASTVSLAGDGSDDFLGLKSSVVPNPPVKPKRVKKKRKNKTMDLKGRESCNVLPPLQLRRLPDPSLLLPEMKQTSEKSDSSLKLLSFTAGNKKEDLLTSRTSSNKLLDPLILQKKVDKCFDFADEICVSDWLIRANKNALELRQWCAVTSHFIDFTQFWLVHFIETQRVELFAMEHEILVEELTVCFARGLDMRELCRDDMYAILCVVFSEYPDKFFGSQGNKFFIDTLVLLMTGKSNNYKKLLAAVRYSSTDKVKLQIVLSLRAFAVFNFFNAILKFFQSYRKLEKCEIEDTKRLRLPTLTQFIQEAISTCLEKDAMETLAYFVKIHKINPNARDEQERSLLFKAVVAQAINCVSWLVKNVTTQVLNMPSESGNTCLHAAISMGNIAIARVLLNASGIQLDVPNPQSGGMTPLGLAVFQGHHSACRLLLSYGADAKSPAPSFTLGEGNPVPLAQFALDLGHPQISLLLENYT